jgi:outer membrane protein assembly factor BamE (lipoprotein component of BamABCDE complex)
MSMPRCLLPAALGCLLLAGCASKFTRENFRMIEPGVDSREDVRIILGDPTFDIEDQWVYDDPGEKTAIVYFDHEGRVIGKEWARPGEGISEDEELELDADRPRERHRRSTIIDDD